VPPLKDKEKFLLEHKKLKDNYRLSCLYTVKGDLEISVPKESISEEMVVLKTGISVPIDLDPAVKKYLLQLKKQEIKSAAQLNYTLESYLGRKLEIPDDLFILLESTPSSEIQITATVYKDKEILDITAGNTVEKNYGLAIDIGTTTLVVELIDLNRGESVDAQTGMNPQAEFGADVISRINFACQSEKNLTTLKDSIRKILKDMIISILEKNEISPELVFEAVIAANTTMNHLFLGLSVQSLSRAPFQEKFTCLEDKEAAEFGLPLNKNAKVYFAPNIKSFVGGDISAGLIAVDLKTRKGNYLFIDLGTNGEVVLKTGVEVAATSTAAGPAFEGVNIQCGMPALPGAIFKAAKGTPIQISSINGVPARGICGTGLIDLAAIFIEKGQITSDGRLITESKLIQITDNIYLHQKDIREIQLAVGAVKTGTQMMMEKFDLKKKDLDGIFVAGAFGNYLNISNSMKVGLLPQTAPEKVHFIGNSSIAGAKALLLSTPAREKIETLVKQIQFISLAKDPSFQEKFIASLSFRRDQ
jgi:uncharacterized 2Fe-2S/4Fe-4S cluster protein (DUF4445 family)